MPWMQAAVDKPFGFRPYDKVLSVGGYRVGSDASAIYPGDIVIMSSDGQVDPAASANPVNIAGVAAAYNAASTANNYFPVFDDPEQKFMVQDDGDTTNMTESSVGNNVALITTTGDTSTLQSLQEIDASSAATTATLAIKVLQQHPIEAQSFASAAGSPRKWIVKINNHFLSAYQQLGV